MSILLLSLMLLAQPAEAQGRIHADKLPLNVQRIKRDLAASADREEHVGLNLRYFLNVYGEAPAIRLFLEGENLKDGPVPYGAPTHQEFLDLWTPKEFRAPVMDLTSFMRWLANRTNGKKTPSQ